MCEMLVAVAPAPFRLVQLWPLAKRLERHGIAGYGWGVAWVQPFGGLGRHLDVRAFCDDPAAASIGGVETRAALVHLRRPSRLTTLGLADTQPFLDGAGRFAFGHNGDFTAYRERRRQYRSEGRIAGRADSEVGLRWLEDAWTGADRGLVLGRLHAELGGNANLMVLGADGAALAYSGNRENPVFRYQLGTIAVASTGIHSLDRSLFRYVARDAATRRLVRYRTTETLPA
jgi:glutamine phosphoribosylpyrophosphate amidotransferase